MALSNLADIADLLAAAGAIASLIYVGYQVRETRTAVRAGTAQARTDLGVHLISSRYTSDIAEILVKSLDPADPLSEAEKFKLISFSRPTSGTARICFISGSRGCSMNTFPTALLGQQPTG